MMRSNGKTTVLKKMQHLKKEEDFGRSKSNTHVSNGGKVRILSCGQITCMRDQMSDR
jgi:hypothetical protein